MVARREFHPTTRAQRVFSFSGIVTARVLRPQQVHGLDLSCLEPLVVASFDEAEVELVEPSAIVTDRVRAQRFELNTVRLPARVRGIAL